jgi:SAM-dependent methyltransferase
MRVVAESELYGYGNLTSINGSAENTTLDSQSVDFTTVAQAFHWFNKESFKAECRRILKPNGKVILVWNSRIFGTETVEDGDKINKKYCPNFKGFGDGMRGTENEDKSRYCDFFVGKYEVKIFENNMTFDLDGFLGRNRSASYSLKEGDENYSAYIAELTECFNRHAVDGKLVMPNDTRSYVGVV